MKRCTRANPEECRANGGGRKDSSISDHPITRLREVHIPASSLTGVLPPTAEGEADELDMAKANSGPSPSDTS